MVNHFLKQENRIARKLMWYVVFASTLITLLTTTYQLYNNFVRDVSHIELKLDEVENVHLNRITTLLWIANLSELEKYLNDLLYLPQIQYIEIIEENKRLIAVGKRKNSRIIEKQFPLYFFHRKENVLIGTLFIQASKEEAYNHLYDQFLDILISNGIKTFLITFFILFLFNFLVTRHLHSLAEHTQDLTIENLDTNLKLDKTIDPAKPDELDMLVNAFLQMQDKLNISIGQLKQSNTQVELLLNSTTEAIYGIDLKGVCTFVNPKCLEILGYHKKEDLIGTIIHEKIFHSRADGTPYTKTELKQRLNLLTDQTGHSDKNVHWRIDNVSFPVEWWSHPIRFNNQTIGSVVTFFDISERIQAEKKLLESEEHYRTLVESTSAIPWELDLSTWQFTYVGPQALPILGYEIEEWYKKDFWSSHIHPDDKEYAANFCIASTERGEDHQFEYRMLDIEGNAIWIRDFVKVIKVNHKAVRLRGFMFDISKIKTQEELLNRVQKMDALGKLTGGVAHDYNNMLNVILGYAELLKKRLENDDKGFKYLSEIEQAALRGGSLSKKLLSFSRQNATAPETTNINEILNANRDMLEKTLTARIKLHLDLDKNIWSIFIDNNDMTDAILNLSINAMHAMPEGGKLTITSENISLSHESAHILNLQAGDFVRLVIQDNGVGMEPNLLEKIFDPFFSTKKGKGTGLGLSQVYGFISRCKGAINVHSDINIGTKFELYFPRHNNNEFDNVENVRNVHAETKLLGNEKILVVDDEPAIRALASEILAQNGYSVITTGNGYEALDVITNDRSINMVLSDVIMPEMDGLQLAKQIRSQFPALRIQLVSGYIQTDTDTRGIEDLIDGILSKPFNAHSLLLSVRNCLDKI